MSELWVKSCSVHKAIRVGVGFGPMETTKEMVEKGAQVVHQILAEVPDPAQAAIALAVALGRVAERANLDVEQLCEIVFMSYEASEE